jgi:hypothetical protein
VVFDSGAGEKQEATKKKERKKARKETSARATASGFASFSFLLGTQLLFLKSSMSFNHERVKIFGKKRKERKGSENEP